MKTSTKSFFEFIVAFCIVLDCECVWKWMHHSGYFRLVLVLFMIVSLFFINTTINENKLNHVDIYKNKSKLSFLLIYLLVFFLYNLFINFSHWLDTIQFVTIVYMLVNYFDSNEKISCILEKCSKILTFLAGASLVFWVLGSVFHFIHPNQSLIVYISNIPYVRNCYGYLHYEMQIEELFNGTIYRNTGIFLEGPKYVLLLDLIMIYELLLKANTNYKRSVILTITAITTMSITGIYVLPIIWIIHFISKYPAKSRKGIFIRMLCVISVVIFSSSFISYVSNSLTMKMETASYKTRMDNYTAGYKAWFDHFWFGAGYLNMDTIKSYFSAFRQNDIGYSNSLFRLLAQGGVYLLIIYIIPVLKATIRSIKNKRLNEFVAVALFIYFFITTSFTFNYIAYIFLIAMFIGIGNNSEKEHINEECKFSKI